jgi:hypothetical protein
MDVRYRLWYTRSNEIVFRQHFLQKGISSIKEQRQQTIILDTKDTDGFINIHIFYYDVFAHLERSISIS